MKYELSNGLNHVYQWDTDITITITEPESVPQVHFKWGSKAVELDTENNQVEIPPELMQLPKSITFWAYTPDHTMDIAKIPLCPRAKPPGYAYTPTEVNTWTELDKQIERLEEKLGERLQTLEDKSTLLYTEQSLTEDQQEQAQTNIGVRYRLVGNAYYVWEKTHINDIYSIYFSGAKIGIIGGDVVISDSDGNEGTAPILVVFGDTTRGFVEIFAISKSGNMFKGSMNLSSKSAPTWTKVN